MCARRASECIPGRNSKLTPRRLSLRFFDLRRARAGVVLLRVCMGLSGYLCRARWYPIKSTSRTDPDATVSCLCLRMTRALVGAVRSARKKGGVNAHSIECKCAPSPPRPARSRDSHRTSAVVHQPGCVCVCVCVCSSSSLNRLVLRAEPRPPFVRARLRSKSGNFLLLLSISTSHQSVSQSLRS